MARTYHLLLAHLFRVIGILFVAIIGINVMAMLIGWATGADWNYPWWSLPVALGCIGFGVLVVRLASAALRRLR